MSVTACVGPERHNDKDGEGGNHDDQRRDPEDERVGLGRHDVFLDQQLEGVGDGLQQAVGADSHRAQANLHVRQNLSLQPVHGDHGDREAEKDQDDIDECPEHVAGGARRECRS